MIFIVVGLFRLFKLNNKTCLYDIPLDPIKIHPVESPSYALKLVQPCHIKFRTALLCIKSKGMATLLSKVLFKVLFTMIKLT